MSLQDILLDDFYNKTVKNTNGVLKLIATGTLFVLIASVWNELMPINKKLWTSSFAFLTVGLDCVLIAGIVYLIDFLGLKKGTHFFLVTGKNPLLIYLISELGVTVMFLITIGNEYLFRWLYSHIFVLAGDYFGAFLFSVWWMLTCWMVGYLLEKKRFSLRSDFNSNLLLNILSD